MGWEGKDEECWGGKEEATQRCSVGWYGSDLGIRKWLGRLGRLTEQASGLTEVSDYWVKKAGEC
jgi:hypothetical protein